MSVQQALLAGKRSGSGTIVLVPFNALAKINSSGEQKWTLSGVDALVLAEDAKYAYCTIANGQNDTGGLDGTVWKQPDGTPFSFTGTTITNLKVEMDLYNGGPYNGFGLAAYLSNAALSWSAAVFNNTISLNPSVHTWYTVFNGANANAFTALMAGDFLVSGICFNHTNPATTMYLDGYRITVSYTYN